MKRITVYADFDFLATPNEIEFLLVLHMKVCCKCAQII